MVSHDAWVCGRASHMVVNHDPYSVGGDCHKENRLHRSSHMILQRERLERARLQVFAQGRQLLKDFPLLFHTLRGHALVPIVCRCIEAAHCKFKQLYPRIKWALRLEGGGAPPIGHLLLGSRDLLGRKWRGQRDADAEDA